MGLLAVKTTVGTVAPFLVLLCSFLLTVIGNAIKGLTVGTGTVSGWLALWYIYVCQSSSSCRLYDVTETPFGTDGECGKFLHHLRATQALCILAAIAAGLFTIGALVLLFLNRREGLGFVRKVGLCMCAVVFVVSLVAFVLYITLKDRKCISGANPKVHAAPFMFLGAAVLALCALILYVLGGDSDDLARPAHTRTVTTTTTTTTKTA